MDACKWGREIGTSHKMSSKFHAEGTYKVKKQISEGFILRSSSLLGSESSRQLEEKFCQVLSLFFMSNSKISEITEKKNHEN